MEMKTPEIDASYKFILETSLSVELARIQRSLVVSCQCPKSACDSELMSKVMVMTRCYFGENGKK